MTLKDYLGPTSEFDRIRRNLNRVVLSMEICSSNKEYEFYSYVAIFHLKPKKGCLRIIKIFLRNEWIFPYLEHAA